MKYALKLVAVGLGVVALCGFLGFAQEADQSMGPEGDAMRQAFGKGSGIRGTVTAAAEKSFTVRTDEGDSWRVFFSENTRLLKDREPIEAGEVHTGDMLIAGGAVDAKAKTIGAVVLFDVDAKQVQQARDAFGKTWVAGKVTQIHELKITIERADDKRVQVVAVDENTSFRKRREDVTLGDVKVGDFITVEGALQADTFLAASLRVMTPGEAAKGKRGPGPAAAPPQPPPGA